jgi:hypothetical protein
MFTHTESTSFIIFFVVATSVNAEFRSSNLKPFIMSTQGSLPPQSETVASSEPLVERVLSKRFLSGKNGKVDTVMQLSAVLTRELAGSFE